MFRPRMVKLEEWRLRLWKQVVDDQADIPIKNPDDPLQPFLVEYSHGLNAGLRMAVKWFERYVEGKE